MGNGYRKDNQNVYFKARKQAALYDYDLYSREGAAEKLNISVSTLADYELGNTKVVPVEKVVAMAELYKAPYLKTMYCKNICPIKGYVELADKMESIEKIVLDMIAILSPEEIKSIEKDLINMTRNLCTEKDVIERTVEKLDSISVVICKLKMYFDTMR